ncbi:deoxycytidylate deaminase [Arthrobacter phage BeatusComedenti]|uniref:Uncharacterized protein n=1 Tax=Arthrobacter phage BeatusComedenti TaxID=2656523 RepID=A0A649VWE5_9CAUD|nr:deoxycytidylate deaminase [Arthrobacter phage BeatusComedenti]
MTSELSHWDTEPPYIRKLIEAAERDVLPRVRHTDACVVVVPEEPDVKIAIEIGLGVMMDKPVILLVRAGCRVPEKLMMIADEIVATDLTNRASLQAALDAAVERLVKLGIIK